MCSWGKLWTKETKRPKNPYCHFWRARSGVESKSRIQITPPEVSGWEEWTKNRSYPSSPASGYGLPSLTPGKQQAHPPSGSEPLVLTPICCSRSPNEALPEKIMIPYIWLIVPRLIIFFAVKDGEVPYSQEKQDGELTEAQIKSSLVQNPD